MPDPSSFEIFAKTVTDLSKLASLLRQAAEAELGTNLQPDFVERRANTLLVEAMNYVGISPKTEHEKRELIFAALKGKPLSDASALAIVEYILGQMIAKPKGALAERLARIPVAVKLAEFQQRGEMPSNTEYIASTWSKRLGVSPDGSATPRFFEWRDGADGVIYCRSSSHPVRHMMTREPIMPHPDAVFILGVTEVKAYHKLKKGEPKRQLDKHLARLTRGLQTRDKDGKIVVEFEPVALYFARWRDGCLDALPVDGSSFEVAFTSESHADWLVSWLTPLPLVQLAIGPTPVATKTQKSRFDAYLPYSEAELEKFGNDVMHYTLGAMGDDKLEVDLPGPEWAWNLEMLFDCVDVSALKPHQVVRLNILLRWLRNES